VRILIIKMSSMGDVVHAQPLATDLRRAFADARIEWVVEKSFASICQLNAAVDAVIPIAWRRWRKRIWARDVRGEMLDFHQNLTRDPFDLVIDCQGLLKSAVVTRLAPLAPGGSRTGPAWAFAREPLAALAYSRKAIVPRDWHVVRRNRAVGAAAGGYALDGAADFGLEVPALAADEAAWLPPRAYALLVTGASRDDKLWPEAHWVQTAQRLQQAGLALVWFWGTEGERLRAERLSRLSSQAAAGAATPAVVPPFLSVHDAARAIAGADIVVGLDTGFTHLAGALGRPTIGIFCDFDAIQCAVTGDGYCASFGGVGQVPPAAEIIGAIDHWLAA
jgi:heptosyltransferase-1